MKRGRRTAAPPQPAGGLPKQLCALAKERLEQEYLGFVSGTSTEDPRQFVARSAAAREALEHLAQLRALNADPAAAEQEPSTDEVLAAARAGMAREDGT
jgi:hypothetical protein